ncbi:MAG: biosynthetic peptidoglycan transglycosylase, partial [Pseudomonadota bacterium]
MKLFYFPLKDVRQLLTRYPFVAYPQRQDSSRYIFTSKKPSYWQDLKTISPRVAYAILVSEDSNFYKHRGFDWAEIHSAITDHFLHNKRWRGASTISQQLAKNLFLGPEKTFWRKTQEMIYTYYLERNLSKSKILELYLNSIEFGDKIYGINLASEFYFSKPAKDLRAKESAFLAMLLPGPK